MSLTHRQAAKESFYIVRETCPDVDMIFEKAIDEIKNITGTLREALVEKIIELSNANDEIDDLKDTISDLNDRINDLEAAIAHNDD